jgi:hypothetical protein
LTTVSLAPSTALPRLNSLLDSNDAFVETVQMERLSRKVVWYRVFFANRELQISPTATPQKVKTSVSVEGRTPPAHRSDGAAVGFEREKHDFSWMRRIG